MRFEHTALPFIDAPATFLHMNDFFIQVVNQRMFVNHQPSSFRSGLGLTLARPFPTVARARERH